MNRAPSSRSSNTRTPNSATDSPFSDSGLAEGHPNSLGELAAGLIEVPEGFQLLDFTFLQLNCNRESARSSRERVELGAVLGQKPGGDGVSFGGVREVMFLFRVIGKLKHFEFLWLSESLNDLRLVAAYRYRSVPLFLGMQ